MFKMFVVPGDPETVTDVPEKIVRQNLEVPKRVLRQDKTTIEFIDCTPEEIAAAEARGARKRAYITPFGTVYTFLSEEEMGEFAARELLAIRRKEDPLSKFLEKPGSIEPMKVITSMEESFQMGRFTREQMIAILPANAPQRILAERIEAEVIRRGVRKQPTDTGNIVG